MNSDWVLLHVTRWSPAKKECQCGKHRKNCKTAPVNVWIVENVFWRKERKTHSKFQPETFRKAPQIQQVNCKKALSTCATAAGTKNSWNRGSTTSLSLPIPIPINFTKDPSRCLCCFCQPLRLANTWQIAKSSQTNLSPNEITFQSNGKDQIFTTKKKGKIDEHGKECIFITWMKFWEIWSWKEKKKD